MAIAKTDAVVPRTVLVVGLDDKARTARATEIRDLDQGLAVLQARTAQQAREQILGRDVGGVVVEIGEMVGDGRPSVLLKTMFGGSAVSHARKIAVLVIVDPPSKAEVTSLVQALGQIGAKRFEMVIRPTERARIESLITQIFGATRQSDAVRPVAEGAKDPFAAVVGALKSGKLALPGAPAAINRIRSMIEAGETGSDAIAEVVECDPAVTAMVLRLAGSAVYRGRRKVRNVREAIMRVGALQVLRIAEVALARGMFVSTRPALAAVMEQGWSFTIARAVIVRNAARFDGPDHQERQYLQATLADVGAAFLVNALSEVDPDIELDERFRSFLTTNHEVVGAALLKSWGAPNECVELALTHHGRIEPDQMPMRLHLAGRVAAALGYDSPFETIEPALPLEIGSALNILDTNDAERLVREIAAQLGESGLGAAA